MFIQSPFKDSKRSDGRFYTIGNPFSLNPFLRWATEADLINANILEPFAGSNNIIESLLSISLCNDYTSYDILPGSRNVAFRDTIKDFPTDYRVCITNPPWLARNSATRRGLPYPETRHDDLYKLCLELCLVHCDYVAALVPASYLQSGLFRDRLSSYILLHDKSMFNDTDNPVCLALFNKDTSPQINIYYDNDFIGFLCYLEGKIPQPVQNRNVRFNDPNGNLGFVSFDSVSEPTIRFCEVDEIRQYSIKSSSRFFTRISGEFDNIPSMINNLNHQIQKFRKDTKDIFLTPFKGIRKDGKYRRRMEFALARRFIDAY